MPVEMLTYSSLPMTTATAGTTYVLGAAEVRTTAGTMIDLDATQSLKFVLHGSLYAGATVLNYGALGLAEPSIDIVVGKTGILQSTNETILAYGDGGSLDNRGLITSSAARAVFMEGDGVELNNSGTMVSFTSHAVYLAGADLRLENSGTISGGVWVDSDAGTKSTTINSGRIFNENNAILCGAGDDKVINSGIVRSEIRLQAGDDIFIDQGGRITSAIMGGAGDDVFVVRTKGLDIRESSGEGTDTVRASISWELDQQFEIGRLTGSKNINLVASFEGAELYGNIGRNKLSGQIGIDALDGGRGNDILTGGSNSDVFIFRARAGDDVITDFADLADRIDLSNYKGIDDFGDIGVKQVGNNVVVSLLGGDTITLRNFDDANLTAADFQF